MNTNFFPNQSCRAYFGDSTQLTYLRARYYSSSVGRFASRDTWAGNITRPLSLNRWNYVNGNPVNYADPSGYSPNCAVKGTCGPNVTDWYKNELDNHYDYGIGIRNKIIRMKALAVVVTATTPCIDVFTFLSLVAIEAPFSQIVQEFHFPKTNVPIGATPLINPIFANKVIDVLGVLEYALYGLAVDYSNVDYDTLSPLCDTGGCGIALKGDSKHQVVSLCGQCRDASDLGNMMFGLGGAARGYSWSFVVGSALLFNKLSGDSTSGWIDGWGAYPGWVIGRYQLYRITPAFCAVTYLPMGHDSVDQIQGCQVCSGVVSNGRTIPSSVIRVSEKGGPNGEATTIEQLENTINGNLDEAFIKILNWYLRADCACLIP